VTSTRAELLEPLRRDPARSAVLVDFDGTLSPIVDRADQARPLPGVAEVLDELAASYAVVAVVSGRPVEYLARHVPSSVQMHGLYGLESSVDGRVARHPSADAWAPIVDAAAEIAKRSGLEALEVEHKGLSLTLHFRTHPEDEAVVRSWAEAEAERTGLVVRPAKMSLELHPPLAIDKGSVVVELAAALDAACFLGDDVGDLPAFDALDRLAGTGVSTLKVAVATTDTAGAVLERCDLVVAGPDGALELLRALVP